MWPWEEDLGKWVGGWRDRLEQAERHRGQISETLRAAWREWAGDLVDRMLADREAAVESLNHHEASVRRCAASVLLHHWSVRPGEEGSDAIHRIATGDPDPETRVIAVRALGNCYENTDDVPVGRTLAMIVQDEKQSPLLRTFAYYALFNVRGLPIRCLGPSALARGEKPRLPRAPEDVDWSFVKSFLVEGRVPTLTGGLWATIPERVRPLVRCYATAEKAYHTERFEEAVTLFTEAIGHDPRLVRTYYMRARALSRLGRFDEAIADLTFVVKSWPDWPEAYEERAQAYEAKGLIKKAVADNKTASKIRRRRGGTGEEG